MGPLTPSSPSRIRSTLESTHGHLAGRLEAAWRRSDAVFDLVRTEALGERPIALRHPLIFYLGHLPAFGWNLLCRGLLGRASFEPELDELFEFGIDPEEGEETAVERWPPMARVLGYRDRVRDELRGSFDDVQRLADDDLMASGGRIFHLVLEHEEMHHETLLYMLQELRLEAKRQPADWPRPIPGAPALATRRVEIGAGPVRLGSDFHDVPFGWDNEFPAREAELEAFRLDSLPVTVGEYRRFVDAGGYAARELWSDEGWSWRERRGHERPKDWSERGGTRLVRTMFHEVPEELAGGWPVSVSHAEASAYCRWRGARLPSEAELARAAYTTPGGDERSYPWGEEPPDRDRGAFDFHQGAPTPVGTFPAGASAWGVHELVGNGWEWTATEWAEHPGFENYIPGYAGYSRDFFDGKHFAMFGGSWATGATLLRRSFRNWFRFNYPYPFTKFRLAWEA